MCRKITHYIASCHVRGCVFIKTVSMLCKVYSPFKFLLSIVVHFLISYYSIIRNGDHDDTIFTYELDPLCCSKILFFLFVL